MPRPLRVEYLVVIYHLMSRGDHCAAIFRGDTARRAFLSTLGEGTLGFAVCPPPHPVFHRPTWSSRPPRPLSGGTARLSPAVHAAGEPGLGDAGGATNSRSASSSF